MSQKSSVLLLIWMLVLMSCTAATVDDEPRQTSEAAIQKAQIYDQNSWKTMIPDACTAYFDGCNRCRKEPGMEMGLCTRMACAQYEKPRCLTAKTSDLKTSDLKTSDALIYQCDGGYQFSIVFDGESADVTDLETGAVYSLDRQRAASGMRYSKGQVEFSGKGKAAVLTLSDSQSYRDCVTDSAADS